MRRRIRRASRRVGIGSAVRLAALTLGVSFGCAQHRGGLAPSGASTDAGSSIYAGSSTDAGSYTDGGSSATSIVVTFGGDVTLGYHYEEYFDDQLSKGRTREEMFAYPFKELNGRLRAADLAVVNLECPFTARGEKIPKNFNFRARPELVSVLLASGVGAVSVATPSCRTLARAVPSSRHGGPRSSSGAVTSSRCLDTSFWELTTSSPPRCWPPKPLPASPVTLPI